MKKHLNQTTEELKEKKKQMSDSNQRLEGQVDELLQAVCEKKRNAQKKKKCEQLRKDKIALQSKVSRLRKRLKLNNTKSDEDVEN